MLPLTRHPIRFTPPDAKDTDKPPVYIIGTPTVAGRAEFRRAIAAAGMRHWDEAAFSEAMRKFLEEVKPDNLAELLAVLDAFAAIKWEALEAIDGESDQERTDREGRLAEAEAARDKWSELLEMVSRQSPRVAAMAGDNLHYSSLSPYMSVSMFLRGWENLPTEFRRLSDGTVPHELLEELPDGHIMQLWVKITSIMRPSRGQEKNSASPSQSAGSQAPTISENGHPTAVSGTSAEMSTE